MTTSIRKFRPTPAFVLAMIALLVAMSGSAVAVTAIASNSIKSKHIANGHVKRADIAGDAVRSAKVLDGTLTGADVADESLTGADVNESTLQGVMASQARMVISQGAPQQFGAERVADCAATEKAIGGGAVWLQPGTNSPTQLEAPITASLPEPAVPAADGATGWRGAGRNVSGVDRVFRVYAVCVPKQP